MHYCFSKKLNTTQKKENEYVQGYQQIEQHD